MHALIGSLIGGISSEAWRDVTFIIIVFNTVSSYNSCEIVIAVV